MDNESEAFRQLRSSRDPQLRERLILEHRWLVKSVTRRYHAQGSARGWTTEDIEQEGIIGLMRAIDRYDPDGLHRGVRFRTVADFAIRVQLRKALQIDIAEQPTMPLIALHPLTPITALTPPAWLQDRITQELEALPSHEPSVEEQVIIMVDGVKEEPSAHVALGLAIESLSSRQRYVIERRYGLLEDGRVWSGPAIAKTLQCTKENVYFIEKCALKALRMQLDSKSEEGLEVFRILDEIASQQAQRAILARQLHPVLQHLIARGWLTSRDQLIIEHRHGLHTEGTTQTFVEIARTLGVSQTGVRNRYAAAMMKLRAYLSGSQDGISILIQLEGLPQQRSRRAMRRAAAA